MQGLGRRTHALRSTQGSPAQLIFFCWLLDGPRTSIHPSRNYGVTRTQTTQIDLYGKSKTFCSVPYLPGTHLFTTLRLFQLLVAHTRNTFFPPPSLLLSFLYFQPRPPFLPTSPLVTMASARISNSALRASLKSQAFNGRTAAFTAARFYSAKTQVSKQASTKLMPASEPVLIFCRNAIDPQGALC